MSSVISFYVNGKLYTVPPEIGEETSLLKFLRNNAGLKGTKYMCKEGACGACTVNYTTRDPITNDEKSFAVNSCLLPALSCHGASITTIEGIGNKTIGYDKVQTALARFNGSQCGFCSPGMVMNMYSLLSSKKNTTMRDVENSLAGNFCRCTGYRPILDAFKSLTSDASEELVGKLADIEDIWKPCSNAQKNCRGVCSSGCLKFDLPIERINNNSVWITPKTIDDVINIFKKYENFKMIAGNTGQGVYKSTIPYPVYVNLNHIKELKAHKKTPEKLELGANMSLTETLCLFESLLKINGYEYLKVLADHIQLVANVAVRNTGTLAGNLMIKYYHPEFPSDLFLLFATVKATVVTVSECGEEGPIPLLEMYNRDMNKRLIRKIILPPLPSNEYAIRTFKIMPKAQNVYALVNAGFLFRLNEQFLVLEKPNILIGNISPNFVHAVKTEEFFTRKNIFEAFKTGVSLLSSELEPSTTVIASAEFKKQLSLNLFYKFILSLKPDGLNPFYLSGGENLHRPLSKGIQEYETIRENWPLTKPINKVEAILQCSGEAEYTNDIPELCGQLFGALVLAEQANAVIKDIDPSEALVTKGVVAFFSAKDIPGKNIFLPKTATAIFGEEKTDEEVKDIKGETNNKRSKRNIFASVPVEEELFCSGEVLYSGQPVGIIIAKTEELAIKAAKLVKIEYIKLKEKLCLTVKDVLQNDTKTKIKVASRHRAKRNINPDKLKYKIEGELEMGPQFHFTMEPQSCVCKPTEDGITIYSSTQWMSVIQGAVSQVLNIPENSINMEVKRIGGGFGSKITRASMVATACALAAFKLNQPIKVILDIETNMKAIGKRNASYTKYEASFDDTGYIERLKVWHYNDGGCSINDPAIMLVKQGMENCYDSSGWEFDLFTVYTSTPSSSWMRGPGTIEGMAAIEEIIEHISFILKKDPLEVRLQNISKKFNFIDSIISTITETSDYSKRKEEIETFNRLNRWKKKGISLVPMVFEVFHFFSLAASVSIYNYDGTVSITHGGIEMGQGVNTKAIQICAKTLGIEESKIKVKSSSVLTSPNAHMSGASITSDNVAYSTMKCCEILNKRLEPIKNRMKDAKWEEIISEAYTDNINLNASYLNRSQDGEISGYNVYGAAVTEVELDVLTGQYQIIRADILEDAGESISPEIDIGQVEGGFVMGLGYLLTENIRYDSETGITLNNNTSTYWVPGAKDIPIDFRVTLLKNAPNPYGVARSKSTGEPPLCLAISAVNALRSAILSARNDSEETEWLPYSQPFSVEKVCKATKTSSEHFSF